MTVQIYAVIAKVAGEYYGISASAGEVVNSILWDGVSAWTPPTGTEARADPTGNLPIGQITTV